jgi:hypothetical protein
VDDHGERNTTTSLGKFAALIVLIAVSQSAPAQKAWALSYSITGPKIAIVDSVRIFITATNDSKRTVRYYSHPLGDGECSFAFMVRNSAGELVKEDERRMSRNGVSKGCAGEMSELILKPGGTINESADLSKLFDLSPGNYTVQVSVTTKSIAVVLPPSIPKPERDPNEVEVTQSNILNLVVVPKPPGG